MRTFRLIVMGSLGMATWTVGVQAAISISPDAITDIRARLLAAGRAIVQFDSGFWFGIVITSAVGSVSGFYGFTLAYSPEQQLNVAGSFAQSLFCCLLKQFFKPVSDALGSLQALQ